ncbi:MAG: GDP-mannose 4,6-dehydratase [Bdellovibrionales bacterium]|nr:GDP-mannose 4,6-dehydratase [Bdellovibrionales bacterium]
MKCVVTGGAGFIGSHVVDALTARGDSVLILDDFSTGSEGNIAGAKSSGANLDVVRCDLCSKDAFDALVNFKPDAVFHLAAQINVRKSVEDPVFDADKNVCGTVNMLEAARVADCPRFVFSSTGGAIYGEQDVFPAPEDHPVHAESPYGISKRAAELYLEYYGRVFGRSTTSLRFSNVYGPRQNPKGEAGVVAIFSERLIAGEALTVFGDGMQTRDFVFVGDVVNAVLSAADSADKPGFRVFNVGTGVETSVMDVVAGMRTAWKAMDKADDGIVVEHAPERQGEQRRSVIDHSKLTSELGWRPKVNLESGLEKTLRSYFSDS